MTLCLRSQFSSWTISALSVHSCSACSLSWARLLSVPSLIIINITVIVSLFSLFLYLQLSQYLPVSRPDSRAQKRLVLSIE